MTLFLYIFSQIYYVKTNIIYAFGNLHYQISRENLNLNRDLNLGLQISIQVQLSVHAQTLLKPNLVSVIHVSRGGFERELAVESG